MRRQIFPSISKPGLLALHIQYNGLVNGSPITELPQRAALLGADNGTTHEQHALSLAEAWGHSAVRSARLHFPNRQFMFAQPRATFRGVRVSQFLSTLLLVAAVVLTVCFGVAAWRLSDEKDIDVTGQIPRQSYGWKQPSRN